MGNLKGCNNSARVSGPSPYCVISPGVISPPIHPPHPLTHLSVHSSHPPTHPLVLLSHPFIHSPSMCQSLCLVLQKLREEKHSPCLQGTPRQIEETVWVTGGVTKVCPGCCGNTERGHLTSTGVGVEKRRPGNDSLRKLLISLVWSSRSLCGEMAGVQTNRCV